MIFGSPSSVASLTNALGPMPTTVHSTVRNLASSLNFKCQVSSVAKISFYQIQTIAKLKPLLSSTDLETLIHAFI